MFPSMLARQQMSLCESCLSLVYHIVEISGEYTEDMTSQLSWFSDSDTLFDFSFLSLRCRGGVVDLSVCVEYVMVPCSLHFVQLWISRMVSVYCKKEAHLMGWESYTYTWV